MTLSSPRFLRTSAPTSVEGIERYLSSGMIRGVGPVYAKKLVRAFGEKVFDIIETGPDRLRKVEGIGPVRAASILAAWAEQKAVRKREKAEEHEQKPVQPSEGPELPGVRRPPLSEPTTPTPAPQQVEQIADMMRKLLADERGGQSS
jgi:NAD-dependent DNA ligase